jgi:hypothetical protein
MKSVRRIGPWTLAVVIAIVADTSAQPAGAGAVRSPGRFGGVSCLADAPVAATRVVSSARAADGPRAVMRPAAQVTRNEQADVTFELRPSVSGGVEVSATSGDLHVTKTVQSSGEFVLELATARDKVTIAVSGQGTTVTRGKTRMQHPRSGGSAENADKVRGLLADSRAVVSFRGISAGLLDADDRSPASVALIVADAAVGMLTGDVGAPRRTARFLAHRANGGARPAGMVADCFYLMEQRMNDAMNDYFSCFGAVYPNTYFTDLCGYRWVLQVESYWFNFLSCSGVNVW